MNLFGWLKPVGRWLKKALNFVGTKITDENIELAVKLVKEVRTILASGVARREWVVTQLVRKGFSENIARLLVEIAVGLVKKEEQEENA